jgi:2-polyprenyl-6-methoxyphenol hydroxylase-like FAD-dependent oxidoreductase
MCNDLYRFVIHCLTNVGLEDFIVLINTLERNIYRNDLLTTNALLDVLIEYKYRRIDRISAIQGMEKILLKYTNMNHPIYVEYMARRGDFALITKETGIRRDDRYY